MENNDFYCYSAMTDIDDELVSEAADPPVRRRARLLLAIAAAAIGALVLAAVLINRPGKKDLLAVLPDETQSPAPFATEEPIIRTEAQTEDPFTGTAGYTAIPTGGSPETPSPAPNTTPQITYLPTGAATATPDAVTQSPYLSSGEPTATPLPTPRPTEKPTTAPEPSLTQTSTEQPTYTPAPSPTPRLTEEPTYPPTPSPTPRPTEQPTAVPTQTAVPTVETTSAPYEPEMVFTSIEDFIGAVRQGCYPLLEGINLYYTADGLPAGSLLTRIRVEESMVAYYYSIPGGGSFECYWFRDTGYSQLVFNTLLSNYQEGVWYGNLYVFSTIAGYFSGAQLDEGHLISMNVSVQCTEEQMAVWSTLTKHYV